MKTSLLRRLQGRPSPAEAAPIVQINLFSKMAVTFEPLKIMDMASAKSDVNGPQKNYVFGYFELESEKKNVSKCIDPLCIGLINGFYIFLKRLY